MDLEVVNLTVTIKERTFFRIKKGDYDNLFKEAIKSSVNDFELELTK